jgi:heme-degrading monooxygenase HmoA
MEGRSVKPDTIVNAGPLGAFVAINSIACRSDYRDRFETLFQNRAHAIESAPGFLRMAVLKPKDGDGDYLVVSFWKDEASFDNWRRSPEFATGHARGFADLKAAREQGESPPMASRMDTYTVLCE